MAFGGHVAQGRALSVLGLVLSIVTKYKCKCMLIASGITVSFGLVYSYFYRMSLNSPLDFCLLLVGKQPHLLPARAQRSALYLKLWVYYRYGIPRWWRLWSTHFFPPYLSCCPSLSQCNSGDCLKSISFCLRKSCLNCFVLVVVIVAFSRSYKLVNSF